MPKEERTPESLAKRLRELLEEDKQSEATRLIERASNEMLGENNFVFRQEATQLAAIDLNKLDEFVNRVRAIREDLDSAYEKAANKLFEGDDNEA